MATQPSGLSGLSSEERARWEEIKRILTPTGGSAVSSRSSAVAPIGATVSSNHSPITPQPGVTNQVASNNPLTSKSATENSQSTTFFGKIKELVDKTKAKGSEVAKKLDEATDVPVVRQFKSMMGSLLGVIKDTQGKVYSFMEQRYGSKAAKGMFLASQAIGGNPAVVPPWFAAIPGSTLLAQAPMIAGAEAMKQGKNLLGGTFNTLARSAGNIDFSKTREMFGKAGGMLGAFSNPVFNMANTVSRHLDTATPFINTFNRGDLTGAQRRDQIIDMIPVLGGLNRSLREFGMAITGATERIRAANVRFEQRGIRESYAFEGRQQVNRLENEQIQAQSGARAARNIGYSPLNTSFDRTNIQGFQAYENYQRLLPLRDQAVRARRESAVAGDSKNLAAGRLSETEQTLQGLYGRYNAAQRQLAQVRNQENGRFTGGVRGRPRRDQEGMNNALREVQTLNEQIQRFEEERRQRIEQLRAASVNASQAESAARRANIEIAREELSLLREKENRIASASRRFGSMHAGERRQSLAALRIVQANIQAGRGLEGLTPEMIQQAERAAPSYVGRAQENFGETTAEYQQARDMGVFEDSESLSQVRNRIDSVQANVRNMINIDENTLAERIAQSLSQGIMQFIQSIESRTNTMVEQNTIGRMIQNNQTN